MSIFQYMNQNMNFMERLQNPTILKNAKTLSFRDNNNFLSIQVK